MDVSLKTILMSHLKGRKGNKNWIGEKKKEGSQRIAKSGDVIYEWSLRGYHIIRQQFFSICNTSLHMSTSFDVNKAISRQEPYPPLDGLASVVACAVIEAVTRPEFVDGLWTGVQLVIRSGLQSVCTNPGGPPGQCGPWLPRSRANQTPLPCPVLPTWQWC